MGRVKHGDKTLVEDDRWKKKGGVHQKNNKQKRRKVHELLDTLVEEQKEWEKLYDDKSI